MQRPILHALTIGATCALTSILPSASFAQVDDLELPAEPAPDDAPTAPPSGSAPPASSVTPAPSASAAAASSAPVPPSAPPPSAPPPSDTSTERTSVEADSVSSASVDFERSVYSRPVARGLKFRGYVQGQFVMDQLSEDQVEQDGRPRNRDEFSLRAARLRVDSGHEYTNYTLELDARTLGGPRVGIRRAEATVLYRGEAGEEGPPLVGATLGVFDVPFGFELVESSGARYFMERSVASEALFPTTVDVGVRVAGGFRFLRYAVGFVNGEPLRDDLLRDRNGKKDAVGRLGAEANIGPRVLIAGGTSFAFGKGFHQGRTAQKDTLAWRDDNEDGVATPGELIGVPGSSATPSENFERWALGLDLGLQLLTPLGLSNLTAEGYVASNHDRGLYVADPVETGIDVRHLGGHVSFTQSLFEYGVVGFRAALYDPNSDFLEQRHGNLVPRSQHLVTLSPLVGVTWPERARLLFQYDFVDDELARDRIGVPTDAENDRWTLRLQVEL